MSDPVPEAAAAPDAAPLSRVEALEMALQEKFGERLIASHSVAGELTYELASADLLQIAASLRDDPSFLFEMCVDVCGVDYLQYGEVEWQTQSATVSGFSRGATRLPVTENETLAPSRRFAVVYHLLSIAHNRRLRLRVFCPDETQPMLDSVTAVWASADWFERETFDMFGILFRSHPDLRRLLTDYGFIGHPFRKDFPLSGNVEVRYDPEKGRVVYQPVSIEPRILVPKVIRHDNRYDAALKEPKPDG